MEMCPLRMLESKLRFRRTSLLLLPLSFLSVVPIPPQI